jgi:methylmalonyl-CoA/ethylmalonyl-CoA epimerase
MEPSPDTRRLDPVVRALVEDLHHVAIVVADLEQARRTYVDLLGLEAEPEPEHVADQKVNVLVCRAGGQRIELVAPASEDSPVSRFLERRGGGLHHLAYRVADLDAALERLGAAGVRLIDDHARPGAHGTRVAFLHPSATGGVLTELVEEPLDLEDWSE